MAHDNKPAAGEKRRWLDDPRNVDKVVYTVYGLCGLSLLTDLVVRGRHGHFPVEGWFGFFCFFGFLASVSLVLAAKALRIVLKRDEDYYDD